MKPEQSLTKQWIPQSSTTSVFGLVSEYLCRILPDGSPMLNIPGPVRLNEPVKVCSIINSELNRLYTLSKNKNPGLVYQLVASKQLYNKK